MDWTCLELKLISCTDLKAFNFFQKLSAYSVVSMVVINEHSKKRQEPQKKHLQRQKTSIQRGGKNLEWNHIFQFDLQNLSQEETDQLFLKFDLRADGFVDRTIGEVRVPLKSLIGEFSGVVRFLTYQVRNSDGKPNGVLKFSYKLKGKIKSSSPGKSHCSSEKVVYWKIKPQATDQSSSPENSHGSSHKVVYPKVELDYNHQSWQRDVIRHPSSEDAAYTIPPVFPWQTPALGSYYSRNLVLPMQWGGSWRLL